MASFRGFEANLIMNLIVNQVRQIKLLVSEIIFSRLSALAFASSPRYIANILPLIPPAPYADLKRKVRGASINAPFLCFAIIRSHS